jgi:hypothetical protein
MVKIRCDIKILIRSSPWVVFRSENGDVYTQSTPPPMDVLSITPADVEHI